MCIKRSTGEMTDSISPLNVDPFTDSKLLDTTQNGPLGVSMLRRSSLSDRVTAGPSSSLSSSMFGKKGYGPQ